MAVSPLAISPLAISPLANIFTFSDIDFGFEMAQPNDDPFFSLFNNPTSWDPFELNIVLEEDNDNNNKQDKNEHEDEKLNHLFDDLFMENDKNNILENTSDEISASNDDYGYDDVDDDDDADYTNEINQIFVIGLNEEYEFGLGDDECTELIKYDNENRINIIDIKCGNQYNIFCDDNNNFWTCGYNKYGSCAVYDNAENITELTEITFFKYIKIKKVCVSIGGLCTFWISEDNKLYGNGYNKDGQLGTKNSFDCEFEPTIVDNPQYVIDVTSASTYSLALYRYNINKIINYWFNNIDYLYSDIIKLIKCFTGNTSEVYSTLYSYAGGNGHGNHHSDIKNQWQIIDNLKDKDIITIKTGYEHSLFLESDGNLLSCGDNNCGELGLGHLSNKAIPTLINFFPNNSIKIKYIECGFFHNLAIDCNNKVYSWGNNEHGECGQGNKSNQYILTPKLIKSMQKYTVQSIKCGSFHSYISTKNGNHFLFGWNEYNECIAYDEEYKENIKSPHLINNVMDYKYKTIKSVHLGHKSTSIIVVG